MAQLPHNVSDLQPPGAPPLGGALSTEVDATAPFPDIVRAYSGYVWRVLRWLGVAEADLDDLCQETFLIVHRRLSSFEGRSALRSWIYGIAFRVASDHRGRAHRRHETVTDRPPERATGAAQELSLEQQQEWAMLNRLLEQLSEEQRQVFVLYEIEELSMREIAEVVKCPLQTAYSRLHAARKQVDAALATLREQEGSV